MALSFAKNALTKSKPHPSSQPAPSAPATPSTPSPAKAGGLAGYLKTGQAAKAAMQAEEARQEKAREEAGKLWNFWMPPDEERTITFLDGGLDAEGVLDIPMYFQHGVRFNGKWDSFVCVAEEEPCPLCERGDSKPTLVGVLTVLDHTPHKIKSGPNAGKTIQHTRKLFVAKQGTLKKLQKKAVKTGGLTGCTFEVTRATDKDPAVGSDFDLLEQQTLAAVAAKYGLQPEAVQPADYGHEIVHRTAKQLIELGLGKALHGIGHEKGLDTKDLAKEL